MKLVNAVRSVLSIAVLAAVGLAHPVMARGEQLRVAAHARIVFVALGASDTAGVGATDPARDNWAAQLARRLPRGSRYVNLGHAGITLGAALAVELPAALAVHPSVAAVWLAVNDLNAQVSPRRYGQQLDRLLAALQRAHVRTFVANVPDLRLLPRYATVDPTALDATVHAYNRAIAADVARWRATLVDLYPASRALIGHPQDVSADGFHPSTHGYALLAGAFYRVMHASHAI